MKNPFRSTRIFLGEMIGELQKCTWPTKTELRDSTIVVVVAAVILGVFTSISDFSLTQVVIKLRKALGDVRHKPAYIQTIAKRGYRLIAPVSRSEESAVTPVPPDSSNLLAEARSAGIGRPTGTSAWCRSSISTRSTRRRTT